MDREKGNLTIEASLVLTMFTFFILFFFSFGQLYKVQNIVSHATVKTAEAISIDSYFREAVGETNVGKAASFICDIVNADNDLSNSILTLKEANISKVIRENFIYCIDNSESNTDDILKKNGVKNGLDGIDFSASKLDGDDIVIKVRYTVRLRFPLFGKEEIELTKASKSHLFKKE